MVTPTQYARYNCEGVPFVCADVCRSCDEMDDRTLVDSHDSILPAPDTAVASGSPSDAEDGAAMSEDEEAGEGSAVTSGDDDDADEGGAAMSDDADAAADNDDDDDDTNVVVEIESGDDSSESENGDEPVPAQVGPTDTKAACEASLNAVLESRGAQLGARFLAFADLFLLNAALGVDDRIDIRGKRRHGTFKDVMERLRETFAKGSPPRVALQRVKDEWNRLLPELQEFQSRKRAAAASAEDSASKRAKRSRSDSDNIDDSGRSSTEKCDVPYHKYETHAVDGKKAVRVPQDMAPSQLKHEPSKVNAAAAKVGVEFNAPRCSRCPEAKHACACTPFWNDFARGNAEKAKRIKAQLAIDLERDITKSQGGVPPQKKQGAVGRSRCQECPQEVGPYQRVHHPHKVARAAKQLELGRWVDVFSFECSRGTGVTEACRCVSSWHRLAETDNDGATALYARLKTRREEEIRRLQGGKD